MRGILSMNKPLSTPWDAEQLAHLEERNSASRVQHLGLASGFKKRFIPTDKAMAHHKSGLLIKEKDWLASD